MRKNLESDPVEPLFYVALVLKGTEDQYLKMLKYIQNRNGAQVVYQCKSLTYLRVSRDDGVRQVIEPNSIVEVKTQVKQRRKAS
jgi:hypothetical protein